MDDQVMRFCSQYLQVEQALDYPTPAALREEATQDAIYQQLFGPNGPRYQPPPRYQLRVLKELVRRVEDSIEDWEQHGVSEDLMSTLAERIASPLHDEITAAQQRCYVTYRLASLAHIPLSSRGITLLESRSVISAAGTTGMRTWEAALHLGRYLCENPSLVQGKRVLELGAGTGYVSILCARHLGAANCLVSDGSDDVVNAMPDNLFLNDLQHSQTISPLDLKWGHALVGTEEAEWNGGRPVDIVLGADLTYDKRLIPALLSTLGELLSMFPGCRALIAVTERSREACKDFEQACDKGRLNYQRLPFPAPPRREQVGPFYSDKIPIQIYEVRQRGPPHRS